MTHRKVLDKLRLVLHHLCDELLALLGLDPGSFLVLATKLVHLGLELLADLAAGADVVRPRNLEQAGST